MFKGIQLSVNKKACWIWLAFAVVVGANRTGCCSWAAGAVGGGIWINGGGTGIIAGGTAIKGGGGEGAEFMSMLAVGARGGGAGC